MKRIISTIMTTALLLTTIIGGKTSNAAMTEYKRIVSGDYEYAVLDETKKTATLLKIGTEKKEMEIPGSIDGYSIVQIGISYYDYDNMFDPYTQERESFLKVPDESRRVLSSDGSLVEKLIIPEGVKKIGEYAFKNTPNLKQLKLPKSLTEICSENFYGATKLKTVTFNNSIVIRKAFENTCFDKVVLRGSLSSSDDENGEWYEGIHCKIDQLEIEGKGNVNVSTSAKVNKMNVSKSVKKLNVWKGTYMKKMTIKNKKTKVYLWAYDAKVERTQFDMGTYAKNKKGKYTWSKPYFKLYDNDTSMMFKKQVSYVIKYKKNGKSRTKTVKKNTIKNLHSSSKIHVYAIVKLK